MHNTQFTTNFLFVCSPIAISPTVKDMITFQPSQIPYDEHTKKMFLAKALIKLQHKT